MAVRGFQRRLAIGQRREDARVDSFIAFLEQTEDRRHGPGRVEALVRSTGPGEHILQEDDAGAKSLQCRDPSDRAPPISQPRHVNDEVQRSGDLFAHVSDGQLHVGHERHGLQP